MFPGQLCPTVFTQYANELSVRCEARGTWLLTGLEQLEAIHIQDGIPKLCLLHLPLGQKANSSQVQEVLLRLPPLVLRNHAATD